jgi:hypothetical protein
VEDGYYLGLSGASTFVVYLVIFPLLHKLYKKFYGSKHITIENTERGHGLLEDQQGDTDSTAPLTVKSKPSVWGDLFFFNFGNTVFVVAYFIVALFRTQSSLFAGKNIAFCPCIHGVLPAVACNVARNIYDPRPDCIS